MKTTDPLIINDNVDSPLIAVNSTGGITLSRAATQEKLAVWIVNHNRQEHGGYETYIQYGAGAGLLFMSLLFSYLFFKKR